MNWIVIAAWAQTALETSLVMLNRFRQYIVLPLANIGGRNMFLLKTGGWIDGRVIVADSQIIARYSSEDHVIYGSMEPCVRELRTRWDWIEVVQGEHDMSQWFTGLRFHEVALSPQDALMLYAHQNAWLPLSDVPIKVMRRDGSEMQIYLDGRLQRSLEEIAALEESINTIQ